MLFALQRSVIASVVELCPHGSGMEPTSFQNFREWEIRSKKTPEYGIPSPKIIGNFRFFINRNEIGSIFVKRFSIWVGGGGGKRKV